MRNIILPLLLTLLLGACSTTAPQRQTLADIDIAGVEHNYQADAITPKTNEEIRKAYADYLKHSRTNDKSRAAAINRLAELEFELANRIEAEQAGLDTDQEDETFSARLDKTIELLNTALKEFPRASKNDKLLYNLANAYDQQGMPDESIVTLREILKRYPRSPYYVEALFRVAEDDFAAGDYVEAEKNYAKIIGAKDNERFLEKAQLKRGWARFKLEYYFEAVDDFIEAVAYHGFDEYDKLSSAEKDIFEEYFRAIGLSFAYIDSLEDVYHYFVNTPDYKYLYRSYSAMSEILLAQNRHHDAVEALTFFSQKYPNSQHLPAAQLKIVKIWRLGGYPKDLYSAINETYSRFHPDHAYWQNENIDQKIYKETIATLKEYVLLITADYHSKFQQGRKAKDFYDAQMWYERYLKHYSAHSRKDNIHFLYAELLSENGNQRQALKHYQSAAYDDDIILNKEAAYNTILITDKLFQATADETEKQEWLSQHINYATLYGQLYPNDSDSHNVISHAAELAFESKQFKQAIALTELSVNNLSSLQQEKLNTIKAHAYLQLEQYPAAEDIYLALLNSADAGPRIRYQLKDKLALAIYEQGRQSQQQSDLDNTLHHFLRISEVIPESDIAAKAMYEAIDLALAENKWDISIDTMQRFQQIFPRHKLNTEVNKKLSEAYLKAGRDVEAAQVYERMSYSTADQQVKLAALWKAAELYESNNQTDAAIKAFSDYAQKYRRPFGQNMEAMQKLITLHTQRNNSNQADHWRNKVLTADKQASGTDKTDRSKYIASHAALSLAKQQYEQYLAVKLSLPLKRSLKVKKAAMQKAVRLLGQASVYNVADAATEATHTIGDIYQTFSQALLDSERPKNLDADALEQYEILLEDQSFPFEEKAIEFYEANMTNVKNGVYDDWIKRSHAQLAELFPVRFKREAKTDVYIRIIH